MDYLALSGGIDSTALALMCEDAQLIFTDTGWEHQQIYDQLTKIEAVTGRTIQRVVSPEGTLPEYIRRTKYFPNHRARYCTRIFKIEAFDNFLPQDAVVLIGLRADEPEREERVSAKFTIRYPLREWGMTRLDCVKLCMEHDLLPRYPAYMARGGCKGCFYKRKSEVVAMHFFAPSDLDELQALEEEIQDQRGEYFYMFSSLEMSIRQFRTNLEQQSLMFDLAEVYAEVSQDFDKGVNCGLFCHR